jgi:hypothetical protein
MSTEQKITVPGDDEFWAEMQAEQETLEAEASRKNPEKATSKPKAREIEGDEIDDDELDDASGELEENESDLAEPEESEEDDEVDDEADEEDDLLPEESDDLDDEIDDEDDDEILEKSDSHGVKKRISKVIKQKKMIERENRELREKLDQLSRAPAQVSSAEIPQQAYQAQFVPPPLPNGQDPSTLTESEKMFYAIRVEKEYTAWLENQNRIVEERKRQERVFKSIEDDVRSYGKRLKHESDRKLVDDLINTTRNFTPAMILAVEAYPNRAQILTYLHKTQGERLKIHHSLNPIQQAAEMVRMAEKFNLERKKIAATKGVKKKAPPPGKIRSKGASSVHSALRSNDQNKRKSYIESLSGEQLFALSDKGLL